MEHGLDALLEQMGMGVMEDNNQESVVRSGVEMMKVNIVGRILWSLQSRHMTILMKVMPETASWVQIFKDK